MRIFITGTGTDVGKTLISSWLCLKMGFDYFKPIQTGQSTDSAQVRELSGTKIYPSIYSYQAPVSPHLAAALENEIIDPTKIVLPDEPNLIIEGAGGLLVPLNKNFLMIDLIQQLNVPVIIVAHSGLGTINHTLLSLEALRARNIAILGVILNGEINTPNKEAIEFYGKVKVLAEIPFLESISQQVLQDIPLAEVFNDFK